MAEIRALGHIPRQTAGLGEETALACRLKYAKSKNLLSESQLAELAELSVQIASAQDPCSASQPGNPAVRDEPLRKRLRVLD